ncbi:hypothetical protein Hanom_Chr11g00968391 [Helianthus anomalus]
MPALHLLVLVSLSFSDVACRVSLASLERCLISLTRLVQVPRLYSNLSFLSPVVGVSASG